MKSDGVARQAPTSSTDCRHRQKSRLPMTCGPARPRSPRRTVSSGGHPSADFRWLLAKLAMGSASRGLGLRKSSARTDRTEPLSDTARVGRLRKVTSRDSHRRAACCPGRPRCSPDPPQPMCPRDPRASRSDSRRRRPLSRCSSPSTPPTPSKSTSRSIAPHRFSSPSISRSFDTVFQLRAVTAPRRGSFPRAAASTLRPWPLGYHA